ncbi:IclR family transcriptional regulator [Actinoplanes sp. NPDC051851]|uniref:IclR family transcriptional regulator n=1 Tax=Actinoplanes sp. NPDC051851 TaxID=3154753 RepID=UPI00343EC57F
MTGRTSDAGNATEKALRLLEAAAAPGYPHRLAAIVKDAAVPKASAHRILQNLVENSFLAGDGNTGYGPGPRLRALAAQVTRGCPEDQVMRDEIEGLSARTGHAAQLGVRTGDFVTCLISAPGSHAVRLAVHDGTHLPLHATAIGKCVLAGLGDDELVGLTTRLGLPARTANTITDLDALRGDLTGVREKGFALDDEENEQNVRCLAAPVRDSRGAVVGGVSISTVTFLESREEFLARVDQVRMTAEALFGILH